MTENLSELEKHEWEPEAVFEAKATVSESTVADALQTIAGRSYADRNPHLGKMIKCQICFTRHRENERKCEQKFATGRYDLRDPKPLLIAGETSETEAVTKYKVILGARAFKGKRHKPHHSHRALLFIEEVRKLTPDEYTQEDLEKARKRAKRILANRYGRHGFLPRIGEPIK